MSIPEKNNAIKLDWIIGCHGGIVYFANTQTPCIIYSLPINPCFPISKLTALLTMVRLGYYNEVYSVLMFPLLSVRADNHFWL